MAVIMSLVTLHCVTQGWDLLAVTSQGSLSLGKSLKVTIQNKDNSLTQ